jgi:large subunit ribosomal protein L3
MTVGLLGRKIGMTQIFDKEGLVVPVTVVKLGDNIVTECMTKEKNGYSAVQVGGFKTLERKLTKPAMGAFKKRELPPCKPLKEFRVEDSSIYKVGEPLKVEDILKEGMLVDVRGRSIGKGFQGTIKRFHAGRGPMSHGSKFHRSMGSIGAGTTPGRVYKGVIMPGHMGDQNKCIRHLKVVEIDTAKGVLLIRGSVPGVEGQIVVVNPSKTKWNA